MQHPDGDSLVKSQLAQGLGAEPGSTQRIIAFAWARVGDQYDIARVKLIPGGVFNS